MKKKILTPAFLLISLLVLLLNFFPNYYGYLKTPSGYAFSGQASWFDPWDINVYVSYIHWGQKMGVLLFNNYTTAESHLTFYHPLYPFLGTLVQNVDPFLLFYLISIGGAILLLTVIWLWLRSIFSKNTSALIAFVITTLGGGLGWLFFPKVSSPDLFMTDFTFTSYFQRGHEALAICLYLSSLLFFYRKSYLWSILSLIFLNFFYPIYIVTYSLITGLYSLAIYLHSDDKKPFFWAVTGSAVGGAAALAYSLYLKSSSFSIVSNQQLPTQSLSELAFGYGILIIFPVLALRQKISRKILFFSLWFIVPLTISFIPLGFSRFYLRTLFFPLAVLTAMVLEKMSFRSTRVKTILIVSLLTITSMSSFYISYARMTEANNNNQWYYLTSGEKQTLVYISTQVPPEKHFLASYPFSNIIPAFAIQKVYMGHRLLVANSGEKEINMMRFYAGVFSEKEAKEFLSSNNIDYVVYGPQEQNISKDYGGKNSLKYPFLKKIYQNSDTSIYQY